MKPSTAPSAGTAQIVPTVAPPRTKWWNWSRERDERNQIEKDASQSHNIRRLAAYGGLVFVGVLYVAGLVAIAIFLDLIPGQPCKQQATEWHTVVAVLIPLFTVPTALVIVILKVTSSPQSSELPTTAYEAMGKMIEKIVDKICGP